MNGQKKFCPYCGEKLEEGAIFCGSCGAKIDASPTQDTSKAQPVQQAVNTQTTKAQTGGMVGFSDRINDSEIKKAIKKIKRNLNGCGVFVTPLPLVIYIIVSFFSDEVGFMDAAVFGGGASLILLIIFIWMKVSSNAKRGWEGVVVDKNQETRKRRKTESDGDNKRWVTIEYELYDITVRTDSGETKHILDKYESPGDVVRHYWYFNVGDRIRCLPQTVYEYEKYDKSHDTEIPCMICGHFNDISEDKCEICGNLLFNK